MGGIIQWILRRRAWVLITLALITAGFGAIASRGQFASSLANLFLGENPEYDVYKERIREFANDEVFVIAYEDPDPLSSPSLARLAQVVRKLKKIKDVGRVESLLDAQHIQGRGDALLIEKYAREARKNPGRRAEVLEELQDDPLTGGLLVSADGRHVAVIVELTAVDERPVERGPEVVEEALQAFRDSGYPAENLHRVGLLATVSEIITQTRYNFSHLFPVVCLVLLVALYTLFKRLWPVLITLVVSFVAVVWTAGFTVLWDRNINILVAMIPSVILIVATSDVIHLCSAYMLEIARGRDKVSAILKSGQEVGTACLMTSATTFVGFVSLSLIPVPAFRQMGLVLGFGVAVALVLAMTLAPVLFSWMREPRPWSDEVSRVQRGLSATLRAVERFAITRPWITVAVFTVVLVASLFGLMYFEIETDLNSRLPEDNPIRIDESYYNQHFVGSNYLEVFVDVDHKDGLLEPDVFADLRAFQRELGTLPGVDKVVSLIDLVGIIDREMHAGEEAEARPLSRELLSQYLLLFEMSGGEDLERFVDFERKTMRMAVRLKDNAFRATYETGERVEALARESLRRGIRLESSGMVYLLGGFLDDVIDAQKKGLLVAAIVIMLMMILWMRSLRVGVVSMLPNLLPILALGGLVGAMWGEVDSDIIAVAMIAIGIGVDDTIHFLTRLRFEASRCADTVTALRNTFHFTGRAIIITTLILTLGFAPFAITDYFSIRILGTLIPFTLVLALLADLLLVPALCQLGAIRFRRGSGL